ncbi:GNAT family N-acetyltransferase [Salinimonas sediminis]|uniref:GNAT family N-acetyltransferase n=1 Tax=Salinimonas sediminis TaxID=2303538 RepID=A0A346NSB2_9ALTE|nr:GNAT family N-acetyltransferase [Salinimonas sediminis]AXR08419.1 GNAT family N-acetyltransferase [Salinimonas sediminis]
MDISLKPIDQSNYSVVCDLAVTDYQSEYVACNMWSLVEAAYNPGYTCRAIYLQSIAVGFIMWVRETPVKISIWRLMVDVHFQSQGIGKAALALAIEHIRQIDGIREIEISYSPANRIARSFYGSLGFKEVGLDESGKDLMAVITLNN